MSKRPTSNPPIASPPHPDQGYGLFDLLWLALKDIPAIMRTLKFAVWVILILALFTLAGTILPQERFARDEASFGEKYALIFSVDPDDGRLSFGEIIYSGLVVPLELYRVFDTGLYFVLLALLAISAALCAYDKLNITGRILGQTEPRAGPEHIRVLPHSGEGSLAVPLDQAAELARVFFRSHRFAVFEEKAPGSTWMFARKNTIRHSASVAFHFAFVIILIGGIIGNERVLGYEGVMAIQEGQSRLVGSELQRRRESEAAGLPYEQQDDEVIELVEYENVYREADFGEIDVETGFPLDYRGMPSDYISHVRIARPSDRGERETVLERAVEVNYPLRYRGVAYYQYMVDAKLRFSVHLPGGAPAKVETLLNRPFAIPGFDLECTVRNLDFVGGVWEAKDGSRTALPFVVRLVDYRDYQAGASDRPLLVGYVSEENPLSVEGVTITLDDVGEYTILQYVHDPGVPIVYLGGFLLILGLTIALYFPYRITRILLSAEGDRTRYVAGGNWSDLPAGLLKAFEIEKKP